MLSSSKLKWFASIILAGILLALGMMGGNWGTSYAADSSVNAAPVIDNILPTSGKVGSPFVVMIISGSGYGDLENTAVLITAAGFEQVLTPLQILPTALSVVIPGELLVEPKIYSISVVRSTKNTIPTIPLVPPWDEVSNPVPFTVYEPVYQYLPIVVRNALFR